MKNLLSILLCFALTGCLSLRTTPATTKPSFFARVGTSISTWWGAHKGQVGQTGILAAKDLAALAYQTLMASAQSPRDASNKADWTDTLAYGVRTMDKSNLVSADKLKAYLAIWTPNAEHWNMIADDTASALLSGGPSAQRLEAVANALNTAASDVRATNVP